MVPCSHSLAQHVEVSDLGFGAAGYRNLAKKAWLESHPAIGRTAFAKRAQEFGVPALEGPVMLSEKGSWKLLAEVSWSSEDRSHNEHDPRAVTQILKQCR